MVRLFCQILYVELKMGRNNIGSWSKSLRWNCFSGAIRLMQNKLLKDAGARHVCSYCDALQRPNFLRPARHKAQKVITSYQTWTMNFMSSFLSTSVRLYLTHPLVTWISNRPRPKSFSVSRNRHSECNYKSIAVFNSPNNFLVHLNCTK